MSPFRFSDGTTVAPRIPKHYLSRDRHNRLGESDNGQKRLEPAPHVIIIARVVERPVVRQRGSEACPSLLDRGDAARWSGTWAS